MTIGTCYKPLHTTECKQECIEGKSTGFYKDLDGNIYDYNFEIGTKRVDGEDPKNDSNIDEDAARYCYAFFDTMIDPDDNRYLSEDYTFCRLWQKLGGSIWLDPKTRLNHVGTYTFEGDVSKIISFNNNK